MRNRRVLISGAGIAGLTLAYWLRRDGFEPTVIEIAPGVRGGGYMLDFWGLGYDVAERMDVIDALRDRQYDFPSLEFVNAANRVKARLPWRKLRATIKWLNLLRSDLERVLYTHVANAVEVRFATSIRAVRQTDAGVEVDLSAGGTENYDLVVGADGLRSSVRRLVSGPDARFEKFLGYYTSSFTVSDWRNGDQVFRSYTIPGKQVGIYSVADHKISAFFVFRTAAPLGHLSVEEQKQKLREAFCGACWEIPNLLERMESSGDFYFDAVSQIEMPAWSAGRVALVGDACQCVSLMGGEGSSLAMAGAYILAGELKRAHGDHREAFYRYEKILKPEIIRKQRMARRFAASFVPSSRFGIFLRNMLIKLTCLPPVARYVFIRRFMVDALRLPEY